VPRLRDLKYSPVGLRGTKPGEEATFIIIADGLTLVRMKPRDQRFGVLNGEGVDNRPVFLGNSQAFQSRRRIVFLWMIFVAVVEGAANDADRVVVGLLRPLIAIGYFGQFRISDLIEDPLPDLRSPDLREELAVLGTRDEC
jgi:hypothetical protein